MDVVLLQGLTGLAAASSLFLVASGLTLIFGVTRVVNFSHGSLVMLGAYLGWTLLAHLPHDPASFVLGVIAAALAVGLIGTLLEVTLLRRIYHAPELFQLLLTFGLVLIIEDVTQSIWGPDELTLPRPRWLRASVALLGSRFPIYDLAMIALGPAVLILLLLLLKRTRFGTLLRAAALDREMLGALGVDQRLLFTAVFALGAALAGLAGALSLPSHSANPDIDVNAVIDAFVVVVVGGMGSLTGAWLASLLIAMLQAFGVLLLPQSTLALAFVAMLVVLALRPYGLLGRRMAAGRAAAAATLVRPASLSLRLLGLAALLVAASAPFWADDFTLSVLLEAVIAVLFAASLHLLMGPGGMPSFGHAAWFGIGAYAAALAARHGLSAGLPLSLLAAGAAALLFGAFVVRMSGVYLAMITLAFAQIVWAVAIQAVPLTGGDNGILGIRTGMAPAAFFWLALALAIGATLLLRRVLHAPLGTAIRATRDSPLRAEAIGLDVNRLRLAAFTLAGASAGLAGGLFTFAKGSAFPSYVSLSHSVDALVMVLLGGIGSLSGPIVGALAYTALYDTLLRYAGLWRLVLGLVIVALVLVFPAGIAGTMQRLRSMRPARRAA